MITRLVASAVDPELMECRQTTPLWDKNQRAYASPGSGLSPVGDAAESDNKKPQKEREPTPQDRLNLLYQAARKVPPRAGTQNVRPTIPMLQGKVRISAGDHQSEGLTGLVDTGADRTVIPRVLAEVWGLRLARIESFRMAGGKWQNLPVYRVIVKIPDIRPKELHVALAERDNVLIGQDLLVGCCLTIDYANAYCSLYELSAVGIWLGRLRYVCNGIWDRLLGERG